MEPPAKRRRKNPLDDDDDDDDELFFQPQEVSARRDPGYKLSVKRANADHKLQATMAHIIEKYSHDFEGVGDEIDMETGEIVVNNGHLHSMRDEGDVGGGWIEDDEDDGIRLEDLTDEQSDEQEENGEVQDSEDDEDLVMKGRQVATTSNAMVSTVGARPGAQEGRLSSLFPNPYGGAFGGPQLEFGASPLAFGASPLAFGNSPLALGPWGLPSGFGAPGWGHQGPRLSHHALPNRLSLTAGEDRYEFPAQEGYQSIWASGSGYEEDWAARPAPTIRTGFRKHLAKYPTKPQTQKLLALAPANQDREDQDDDDEEAIMTGRSSKEKADTSNLVIGDRDDEDDLVLFNADAVSTPVKSSPAYIKGKVATRDKPTTGEEQNNTPKKQNPKKRKRQIPENAAPDSQAKKRQLAVTKVRIPLVEEVEGDLGDRRRSGRVRKQTEFMGKICWLKADGRRKTAEDLTIELLRADPGSQKDFTRIDNVTGEEIHPAAEETEEESDNEREEAVTEAAPLRVIPDSQDSATPPTSSAAQGAQTSEDEPRQIFPVVAPSFPGITRPNGADSACALSDDEAPVLLPVSKLETTPGKLDPAEPQVTKRMAGPEPEVESEPQPESLVEIASTDDVRPSPASTRPRKRGRPRKSEALLAQEARNEPNAEEPSMASEEALYDPKLDEPGPERRKKGGRLRKSDVSLPAPDGSSIIEAAAPVAEAAQKAIHGESLEVHVSDKPEVEQPRKRGRPRKSDSLATPKTASQPHTEDTQSAPDQSVPISPTDEPASEPPRKRGRPRKSEVTVSASKTSSTTEIAVLEDELAPEMAPEMAPELETQVENSTAEQSEPSKKPPRLSRELRWLQKRQEADPQAATVVVPEVTVCHDDEPAELPKEQLRSIRSTEAITQISDAPKEAIEFHEQYTKGASSPTPAIDEDPYDLPGNPSLFKLTPNAIQSSTTPKKLKSQANNPSHSTSQQSTPSKSKPQTPRHTNIRTSHAPSSRRSILSLLSDDEDDKDELSRNIASLPQLQSSGAPTRKLWRSSALTTEIYRTPVKKRTAELASPGSTVKTPGGTTRMCGVAGYRCGRDFCFTCL
ncbi:Fc.00g021150.m01.CDS01 [Cosmosporella sp. VM-42]